ncbi:MAG: hypothetical protein MJ174_08810 [Treponema sp.]|nr:hypothetical protein [Treponema sp.]
MQELRSTEVLDREIQSEARKKAENILEKADADSKEILNSVETKINEALKEKEAFYAKKLEAVERDLNAAGPLEKQRFEVSFVQNSFLARINDYLENLSEDKRIEIVTKKLNSQMINEQNLKLNAYVYGFSTAAVKKLLEKQLGANLIAVEKTEFGKYVVEDDIGLKLKEGIILESQDKSYRCRLTLSETISHILDKYRAELSEALFSGN